MDHRNPYSFFFVIILIGLFIPVTSFGQIPKRAYGAKKLQGKPPVIDGLLTDKAWSEVAWGDDFIQFEPSNNKPPSQKTAFKILYDDNNIYVGIRCYDTEPDKIERRLSRRDQSQGDWVAVAIDSYHDNLTAFAFAANAMGVKFDAKFTDDNNMDITYDPVWYVKTSIDSKGWVAEMQIPLSQLRFSKSENHVWGLQFIRNEFRKQETSVWQPVSKENSGWVSQFGLLKGIADIHPKREIALTPYVMGNFTKSPKEEGNPFATGSSLGYSMGMDGKIAVTNDLTLNFTINPDFGQVEADPSEVNLSAFESYFQERRPFFVEGNNIFNFPLFAGGGNNGQDNLFYSRRIGRQPHNSPNLSEGEYAKVPDGTKILGAFKLSGKSGKGWSIGILESLTNYEKAIVDSAGIRSKQGIEPMTNYFNVRVQKDIHKGKTIIGGMFTATNRFIKDSSLTYLPSAAYTGGIDFQNFWKDKEYRFSMRLIGSSIRGSTEAITDIQIAPQRLFQRPDGVRKLDTTLRLIQGTAASAEFAKIGGGHWRYGLRAGALSPGLELNDQGYLRVTDMIKQVAWLNYTVWEPFGIFRSMNLNMGQWSYWDFGGTNTLFGSNIHFNAQFKNFWFLYAGINRKFFELDRHELRGGPAILKPGQWHFGMGIGSDDRKKLSLGSYFAVSKADQAESHYISLGMNISYQPIPSLRVSLSPNYDKSFRGFIYVSDVSYNGSTKYIVSSIKQESLSMSLRINFSLTPDFSIEFWGQPFMFSGKYFDFKKVVHPNLAKFNQQFYRYSDNEISFDAATNQYLIDDTGNGSVDFTVDNPDFSFVEFRSNLVARWEFVPGSTVYLVWAQGRSNSLTDGTFQFAPNMQNMFSADPTNVFLLKFSYRFSK